MKPSTLLLILLGLAGCADGTRGTAPVAHAPQPPPSGAASMRGTVDVAAGTLTFETLPTARSSHAGPGALGLASIYGDQGVTVRLYNSPVTVAASSTPGKETYTAAVGVRNLLAHSIGDEQAGLAPLDTMGIYVF